ncbi:hypothetical protein [Actinomadura rubrisoli]|uniref:Uncharacterized protein n=1 Tax=Actinomadura rubrisoli TaxID=2530368 RepID=A0A4R5CJT5_9ACTN|nr:hypothetical protein [Actinomadura rubrisoli]TDD97682.1 hypothetical protein E1298_01205 [Actinomadura rubrisoli]
MAGSRRAKGKPMRRTARFPRRLQRLNEALAATTDPRARVMIAADHYRAGLAAHPDPQGAERLVQMLVDAGNRLYRKTEGGAGDGDTQ